MHLYLFLFHIKRIVHGVYVVVVVYYVVYVLFVVYVANVAYVVYVAYLEKSTLSLASRLCESDKFE